MRNIQSDFINFVVLFCFCFDKICGSPLKHEKQQKWTEFDKFIISYAFFELERCFRSSLDRNRHRKIYLYLPLWLRRVPKIFCFCMRFIKPAALWSVLSNNLFECVFPPSSYSAHSVSSGTLRESWVRYISYVDISFLCSFAVRRSKIDDVLREIYSHNFGFWNVKKFVFNDSMIGPNFWAESTIIQFQIDRWIKHVLKMTYIIIESRKTNRLLVWFILSSDGIAVRGVRNVCMA